ncbi:hypothetical protein HYU13_02635 [Candidatus Woesearchaeota archaeon]|nr:hypothetical protein [Candidatus Woesearchaeota archaeon]
MPKGNISVLTDPSHEYYIVPLAETKRMLHKIRGLELNYVRRLFEWITNLQRSGRARNLGELRTGLTDPRANLFVERLLEYTQEPLQNMIILNDIGNYPQVFSPRRLLMDGPFDGMIQSVAAQLNESLANQTMPRRGRGREPQPAEENNFSIFFDGKVVDKPVNLSAVKSTLNLEGRLHQPSLSSPLKIRNCGFTLTGDLELERKTAGGSKIATNEYHSLSLSDGQIIITTVENVYPIVETIVKSHLEQFEYFEWTTRDEVEGICAFGILGGLVMLVAAPFTGGASLAIAGGVLAAGSGAGAFAAHELIPEGPKEKKIGTREVKDYTHEKKDVGDNYFNSKPTLMSNVEVKDSKILVSIDGTQKEESLIQKSGLGL